MRKGKVTKLKSHMYRMAKDLWPINRSITGKGLRDTLSIISKHLPNIKIKKIASGTKVFDWKIPEEWNVSEAFILTPEKKNM